MSVDCFTRRALSTVAARAERGSADTETDDGLRRGQLLASSAIPLDGTHRPTSSWWPGREPSATPTTPSSPERGVGAPPAPAPYTQCSASAAGLRQTLPVRDWRRPLPISGLSRPVGRARPVEAAGGRREEPQEVSMIHLASPSPGDITVPAPS